MKWINSICKIIENKKLDECYDYQLTDKHSIPFPRTYVTRELYFKSQSDRKPPDGRDVPYHTTLASFKYFLCKYIVYFFEYLQILLLFFLLLLYSVYFVPVRRRENKHILQCGAVIISAFFLLSFFFVFFKS